MPEVTTTAEREVPSDGANPLFTPYFAGLAAGELRFPRCDGCGRFHWYPKLRCPHCGGTALTWVGVDLTGTLFSWTTVRHPFSPDFRDRVPYIVGLVELPGAPGVRLVTQVVLPDGAEPRCGLPVRVVLPAVASGNWLVTVVPVSDA